MQRRQVKHNNYDKYSFIVVTNTSQEEDTKKGCNFGCIEGNSEGVLLHLLSTCTWTLGKDEALQYVVKCQQWLHHYCASVTVHQYKEIKDNSEEFHCPSCSRAWTVAPVSCKNGDPLFWGPRVPIFIWNLYANRDPGSPITYKDRDHLRILGTPQEIQSYIVYPCMIIAITIFLALEIIIKQYTVSQVQTVLDSVCMIVSLTNLLTHES